MKKVIIASAIMFSTLLVNTNNVSASPIHKKVPAKSVAKSEKKDLGTGDFKLIASEKKDLATGDFQMIASEKKDLATGDFQMIASEKKDLGTGDFQLV